MFSVTSTAPAAVAAAFAAVSAANRQLREFHSANKKRQLKPFKHGWRRQERLQSSFLLD
jgi:hypothetical protein